MDFRGLTTKELSSYGGVLERYLKDPEFQKTVDDFAKSKGIGSGHLPEVQGVDQQLRIYGINKSGSGDKLYPSSKNNEAVRKFISDKEVSKGIYNPATTVTEAQKQYLDKLMESKDDIKAAKSYLEKEYPFANTYGNLTEADKIYNEKLANAAREKIKNPSSKVWDSMIKEQGIIGGNKFSEELPRAKAMADEIRKINSTSALNDLEKFILKHPAAKEMAQGSRSAVNTLGKAIGPAIAVAEGGLAAQGVYDKMKAGESFKEATSNPELIKNAARGVLGYMGGNAGAAAGAMVPGNLPVKIGSEITGAVMGGYAGTKLADLLTGNPVLDKIIRDRYEKARNERIAQTKPTAASSVELRPGE